MDLKAFLHRKLKAERQALLWKAEGLGERDLRLPRTVTGTNLGGLLKHCAMVEYEYFVPSFGLTSEVTIPQIDYDVDPNGDFYVADGETAAEVVDLYRRVGDAVDAAIESLEMDAAGSIAWWPEERRQVTLGQILVHVLADIARHAGHADIVREGIDGTAGLSVNSPNLWEPDGGWAAHVSRLTALADDQ